MATDGRVGGRVDDRALVGRVGDEPVSCGGLPAGGLAGVPVPGVRGGVLPGRRVS